MLLGMYSLFFGGMGKVVLMGLGRWGMPGKGEVLGKTVRERRKGKRRRWREIDGR